MTEADSKNSWREAVANLKTWTRAGERAVHKPLLTLLVLARAASNCDGRFHFAEIDEPLSRLLTDFGPPRKSVHPEYPFWYLKSSEFWKVEGADKLPLKKAGHSPTRTTLRSNDAVAHVPEELWLALRGDPQLRHELAERLLQDFWPPSMHSELRDAIGLPQPASEAQGQAQRKRDPAFREAVLRAYERRCAVCGYDGRLGRDDLALEAAHIRWHCYDGPDGVTNGLAMCSFHHSALDKGALGVENDRVIISADVHGGDVVEQLLFRHGGQPLRRPLRADWQPKPEHFLWHRSQVFRDPSRG